MKEDLTQYSAYQGGSWSDRSAVDENTLWPYRGLDSEWATLRSIVLYRPPLSPVLIPEPERVQHLRPLDWNALGEEQSKAASFFVAQGVAVYWLDADDFPAPLPNLMFLRDHFLSTPWGVVLGRLAGAVRAGEEKWAQLALAKAGAPLLASIRSPATFEGADALWLRPGKLLLGVGNRTNSAAHLQLQGLLHNFGVEVTPVPLPRQVQHLLGAVQIVGEKTALVRTEITGPEIQSALHGGGYRIFPVPECKEVTHGQAMNVVCLGPHRIVMPDDCQQLRALFESYGLETFVLPIGQLRNAAGGIACATGLLGRALHGRTSSPTL